MRTKAILLFALLALAGCDNWMMPGGWAGQDKAWKDCRKAGKDCVEGYNIIGSPSQ